MNVRNRLARTQRQEEYMPQVSKAEHISIPVPIVRRRSLNWLGFTMFVILMAYPFFAQYLPTGIRQYLSATLR
jgi:hypothetical protein